MTPDDCANAEKGSRFDMNTWLGPYFTFMYAHPDDFKAVNILKEAAVSFFVIMFFHNSQRNLTLESCIG